MSLLRKALASLDESHRRSLLESHLSARVSRSIGRTLTADDRRLPLSAVGLDSLKAVELQHGIELELGVTVPMADVLAARNIPELAAGVLERMMTEARSPEAVRHVPATETTRLSRGQEALWFLQQLSPESTAYNVAYALRIRSSVDSTRLKQTFQTLVDRHSCLRTRFKDRNGRPWADIKEREEVSFADVDAAGWSDARVQEYLVQQSDKPFDLEHGPLFAVHLLTRSRLEHVLLICVHHICVDFWSLVVLMDEMGRLYAAEDPAAEQRQLLPPARYAEFVGWQDEMLGSEAGQKHEAYWLKQLSGNLPVLDLPTDRPRPATQTHRGASHSFQLDGDVTSGLRDLAQRQQVTLYTLLLAAFQSLLHRYTGITDVVIGSPMAGRSRAEFGGIVGYFTNMVALRGDLSGDPVFTELLARTRSTVLGALAHQDFPFAILVDRLEASREPGRSPVFQTAFVLEKPHIRPEFAEFVLGESGAAISLGELQLESLALEQRVAQFDLTLMMVEAASGLRASIQYNADLFDPSTIVRLAAHFQTLVRGIVADPRQRLSELPLLSREERQQLSEWKGAAREVSPTITLQALFEEQVERTPDAIALVWDDQQLTYSELNCRANQLAHHLRKQGVGPEQLIGICLDRSPNTIVSILAILKAGGAYFPLDPSYPEQRLSFMLRDGQVRLVIGAELSGGNLPQGQVRLIALDQFQAELSKQSRENPTSSSTAQNLAYVMYTSGSTGTPNGVAVCQQSVVRLVQEPDYVELTENEVVLQFAPHTFDAATFEVWASLLHGGKLVLLPHDKPSLEQFSEALARHRVSTLWLTSGLFHQMVDHEVAAFGSVRQLLAGGDVLSVNHVQKVLAQLPSCRLINGYGPTENTTFTCCHAVQASVSGAASVPIGRPINGTEVFVVDQQQRAVPVGVTGELVTGGAGLARGYLGRPALTAEKFVPSTLSERPGSRVYQTGDLVRYQYDGAIEFVGRIDHQLKIRGFRVEIGEIENALTSHPAIRASVVVAQADAAAKRLIAYLVADSGAPPSTTQLRDYVRQRLPDYMVPAVFIALDSFPLTPNGKVDRRALPAPDQSRPELESEFVAPREGIEEQLAGIWSELLGVDLIGRHDNFFALGGHSLIGTQVISRIRQITRVELPLRSLFERPTVAGLAEWIESAASREHPDHAGVERLMAVSADEPPLSFSQERFWLLEQLAAGAPIHNIPAAIRLTGPLCVGALDQAISEISRRHEVLRTRFRAVDGRPVPMIGPASARIAPIADLSHLAADARAKALERLTRSEALRAFDVAGEPLLRVSLVRSGDSQHLMFVTLHHIVADGWSIGILIRELASLYKSFCSGDRSPLAELPIQYRDFAHWQRRWLQGTVLNEQQEYWRKALSGASAALDLPIDRPRTSRPSYRGSLQSQMLGPELVTALQAFGKEHGLTPFMIMLAALKILLARVTGQNDLVLGTVTSGRTRTEIEPLIGCFINFLPLRTTFASDETGHTVLQRVRTTVLDANAHQECPFQKIIEAVQPERSGSQNPLFNVTFQLENYPQSDFLHDTLKAELQPPHRQISLLDLRFVAAEVPTGTQISCEYSTDLFDAETIKDLLVAFSGTLEKLVHEPETRLHSFAIPDRLAVRAEAESVAIAATFTAEPVEESIGFWTDRLNPPCKTRFAPFGQVFQQLLASDSLLATNRKGLNVVLVRLDDWQGSDRHDSDGVEAAELQRKVEEFGRALTAAAQRTSTPYLVCLCPSSPARLADPDDQALHERMESLLAASLEDVTGVTLAGANAVLSAYPVANYYDSHGDSLGRIPYTREFFAALGTFIVRHFSAIKSSPRKVIVLDCDQTLWTGVCAEDGPDALGVDLGRTALQAFMVAQHDAGRLLCICSKNSEADVFAVFDGRRDMPLRREHIVSWRINWRPKSENIKSLAEELQLGLDSFVFLDDSAVECAEVRANCPEVLSLQVPEVAEQLPAFLRNVWAFDTIRTTDEDRQRTRLYRQNAQREQLRERTLTFAEFLAALALDVRIDKMQPHQLPRVAQLTQRTNQFNVSKAGRSESELDAICREANADCLTVEVSDRFGDYGLVGVVIFKAEADRIAVDTFLLSCRALGRGVEHRMLARLGEIAAAKGLRTVHIPFKPTARNQPALEFLNSVGARFKQPAGDLPDFVFPAQEALAATFRPEAIATTNTSADVVSSGSAPPMNGGWNSARLCQISAELRDLPRILEAIDDHKRSRIKSSPASEFVPPRTETERLIAGIWEQLLGLDRVGLHEDFFELGGHSLLATQVISRLCDVFRVNLQLQHVFDAPTVSGLARIIDEAKGADAGPVMPPVERAERDTELPLSFAQERLWFLEQLEGSVAYNVPAAALLDGRLQVAALEQGLGEIVRRHEALRTTFPTDGDRPRQAIGVAKPLSLRQVDLRHLTGADRLQYSRRLADEEARRPFDLSQGPLIRAMLVRLEDQKHIVFLTVHHVVFDGWSGGVLVSELSTFYGAFSQGRPSPSPELAIQYADFSLWQREWLKGSVLESKISYWRDRLAGAPPSLLLPTDRPRPAVQSHRGATQSIVLSENLSSQVKALSQRHGATVFCTLLAAFQTLLHRCSGQHDILVGTPVAGRSSSELERMIGFFVNTVVLRADTRNDPTFGDLLAHVREGALEAWAHQELPFEKLVDALAGQRDLSQTPLFQVMFAFQNAPAEVLSLSDLAVTPFEVRNQSAKFDLLLEMSEIEHRFTGELHYDTDLFDDATMRRFLGHFENLLKGIVADPNQRLSDLPLLAETERRQLLQEWNNTQEDYPQGECLHELIELQVSTSPDAVALVFEEQQLTYRELNRKANQLARYLKTLGVGPEARVGLFMPRSLEMVVGVLGVLKAGGAYVPMDPAYPAERLAFILRDSGATVLLTEERQLASLPAHAARVACLDSEWPRIAAESGENPYRRGDAQNLSHVIYTSGSTGQPKGVAIEQRSVVTLLHWSRDHYSAADLAGVLAATSICFDLSVWELFVPLSVGGTVILAPTALDLPTLPAAERVTLINTVPSAISELVRTEAIPASVRTVNLAGEPLTTALSDALYALGTIENVCDLYGPSEDTTYSTYARRSAGGRATIGRPLANTRIYLGGTGQAPVPIGVSGELHVAGSGLARGYLDRPDLTAERFLPDSLSGAGERVYRTGDLARWHADGNLDFLGRIDHQVKVRGFRIELGEIEAVLREHPAVHEAIVLAREDQPGDRRLVAYLTNADGASPTVAELRGHLRDRLPGYMIPAAFLVLNALPSLPNGKVDRRALPAPDQTRPDLEDAFVAAHSPVERRLAEIWCQVLGLERVGVHDNFFELGGHSLLATKIVSRIRAVFGTELPLRRVFESPTVSELAKSLGDETARPGVDMPLERTRHEGSLPLSFAQQRLWFLDQMEPGNPYYNMPAALRVSGHLHVAALERAFSEIRRRHEVLQTRYALQHGQPMQVRLPHNDLAVRLVDLSSLDEASRDEHVRRLAALDARRPFDISIGEVLRVTLLKCGETSHTILFAMHHIVSDGWSLAIVVRELSVLYAAFGDGRPAPLDELPVQYADFAVWQRRWLESDELKLQLAYWKSRLSGQLPTLDIRTDRPRPEIETFRGADEILVIPQALSTDLNRLSAREHATLFMTLVAAYKTLLYRNVGEDDVIVGTDLAGRNRAELEGLVGFFVNLLVLRTDLSGNPTFRDLLARVRETAMGALAHQDVPFDRLVEELRPKRHRSRTPLFQMLFVMENVPLETLRLPGLTMTPIPSQADTARFDLALFVREQDDGIVTKWTYKTDLFDRATIQRLANQYLGLLENIAAAPDTRLNELELRTQAEIHQQAFEENRRREARMSGLVPGRRRAKRLPLESDGAGMNSADSEDEVRTP